MKAYLARLNSAQQHPREIVGLFIAHTHEQLLDLVDECCDIDCVEVMEMGPGGIYWSGRVDYFVPHPKDRRDEAPDLPGEATASELWLGALFDENEDQWQQLTWAANDVELVE